MTTSPDDQQELEKEIERTREQLGETVEALAAKVDVKARVQEQLSQLVARLKGMASAATGKAKQLRLPDNLQDKARQQAAQASQQVRKRPVPVAISAGALGALILFFTLIRRSMRRAK